MMNKLKKLYNEWKDFLVIRTLCRTVELSETHKSIIRSYNKEYEKEMNALVLHKLGEEMLKQNVTSEFNRGFQSALTWRIAMMAQSFYKFPIINNKE